LRRELDSAARRNDRNAVPRRSPIKAAMSCRSVTAEPHHAAPLRPDIRAAVELAPGVHWVGAFDADLRAFDLILRTANGTSYNAYLVRGASGVAVIDTVKAGFADDFFARLETVARYDEISAIVLNHLEPDHTGALPELMRRAPQAIVYMSTKAPLMLKALLKPAGGMPAERLRAVGSGDSIELGGRTLRFLHTPYLHWPDTQCSFLDDAGILFSGDIFGCHFCDTRLFNDKVGDFRFSFEYYFAHLMRPFRRHLHAALAQIEALPLTLIAPAHGPVLRHAPGEYVRRYREMSQPRLANEAATEKTLLVFYLSAYGNTRRMAEAIRDGAETVPGVRVSLYDLEGCACEPFVDLIEEADGLLLGSPTINGDAAKPMWDLLSSLSSIALDGKQAAAFGSYGWSGEAVRMIEERLRGLRFEIAADGLRIKLVPDEAELARCRAFGAEVAGRLRGGSAAAGKPPATPNTTRATSPGRAAAGPHAVAASPPAATTT
jgi:flavorubredoxin